MYLAQYLQRGTFLLVSNFFLESLLTLKKMVLKIMCRL